MADETTDIKKTYIKRGSEKVDLDIVSNYATSELNNVLSLYKFNPQQRKEILDTYTKLLRGLYDGTVTYNLDGTFDNKLGISDNNTDGTNTNGVAANVIGSVIRSVSAYVEPKPKADPNKIKWEGLQSIGNALIKELFSNPSAVSAFQYLDYDQATGSIVGNRNRAKKTKLILRKYILDDAYNIFDGITPELRQSAILTITDLLNTVYNDDLISEHEYFDIANTLGINPENWYGLIKPKTLEEILKEQELAITDWGNSTFAKPDGITLGPELRLDGDNNLGNWSVDILKSNINKISDVNIIKNLILNGIYNKSAVLANVKGIRVLIQNKNGKLSIRPFTNSYIVGLLLQKLKSSAPLELQLIGDSKQYVIPRTYSRKRQTILIWDETSNKISERFAADVPDYVRNAHSYFLLSQKLGGRLIRKGESGLEPNWYEKLRHDYTKDAEYDTSKLFGLDTNGSTLNDNYTTTGPGQSDSTYIPTDLQNFTTGSREYKNEVKKIEDQQYYSNFTNSLFDPNGGLTAVGKAWAKLYDESLPEGSLSTIFNNGDVRNSWTKDGITYTNVRDYIEHIRNDLVLGPAHSVFRKTGTRYYVMDANGSKVYISQPSGELYKLGTPEEIRDGNTTWHDIEVTLNTEANGDATVAGAGDNTAVTSTGGGKPDTVNPEVLYLPPLETLKMPWYQKALPFTIAGSRLAMFFHNNRKNYDTLRPPIIPVLKENALNSHRIEGAYGFKLETSNLGISLIDYMRNSKYSDPSLMSNLQLEGYSGYLNKRTQGFISDNEAIKKNMGIAALINWENAKSNVERYNFNMNAINYANREKSQLKAAYLKANQASIDNFLLELGSTATAWIDKAKEDTDALNYKITLANADTFYSNAMRPWEDMKYNWETRNPDKELSIESPAWYRLYTERLMAASRMKSAILNSYLANSIGRTWINPYSDYQYNNFLQLLPPQI